jgi:hypothetical protein
VLSPKTSTFAGSWTGWYGLLRPRGSKGRFRGEGRSDGAHGKHAMPVIDFNQWGAMPSCRNRLSTLARLAIPHAREILEAWMPGEGRWPGIPVRHHPRRRREFMLDEHQHRHRVRFRHRSILGDLIKLVTVADGVRARSGARLARFIGVDFTKPLPPLPPCRPSPDEKYQAGRETARRLLAESEPCPADFRISPERASPAIGVMFHKPTGNMIVPLFDEKGSCGRFSGSHRTAPPRRSMTAAGCPETSLPSWETARPSTWPKGTPRPPPSMS